jgi:hypothetical protein
VSIITSSAERRAAVEFARAEAMRPKIVGGALQKIGQDPEVAKAMFDVLEVENLIKGDSRVTFLPENNETLAQLLAALPGR